MPTSMIHSSLALRAFKHCHVPVGKTIVVNEGGEHDGTFNVNTNGEDFNEVFSALTGAVLSLHTTQTMVMPSNADRLNDVLHAAKEIAQHGLKNYRQWDPESLREAFESFVEDIESVQDNLRASRGDR